MRLGVGVGARVGEDVPDAEGVVETQSHVCVHFCLVKCCGGVQGGDFVKGRCEEGGSPLCERGASCGKRSCFRCEG